MHPANFIQQVNDFKHGLRKTSEPAMRPPQLMVDTAKAATDADIRTAAEYFSALKLKPWIKVVESGRVQYVPRCGSDGVR